jgi:hypothetical protein
MTMPGEVVLDKHAERRERRWPTRVGRLLFVPVILALLFVLYLLIGALLVNSIEIDTNVAADVPAGGSEAVEVAARLIDREVNDHPWIANDPFFLPGSLLDNMPSFQVGLVSAVGRFVVEMRDQVARLRGSSRSDPDLEAAAGRLAYPGHIWVLEWSATPVQPSSESQYRRAVEDLRRYDSRLAEGQATFERRSDNLQALLDRMAADLGSSSAVLSEKIERDAGQFFDSTADDIFYSTQGRLYGYYAVLRGLGRDFAGVLAERGAAEMWESLIASLGAAASLQPWIVANAPLDSTLSPNHLAAQGFLLLRARTQLREITSVLQR